jgi:hypothetical protein
MQRPGLIARALIALLAFSWAAPLTGAAHWAGSVSAEVPSRTNLSPNTTVPLPVRLREVQGRGLLVEAWVDGSGPYVFAVDTGAGTTLIRSEIVARVGLSARTGKRIEFGGLSNRTTSAQQVVIKNFALGDRNNFLPSRHTALVVSNLPSGVDGILDPTEAYAPLGYVIDMPNRRLLAFDTASSRLRVGAESAGGAVVRWVRESGGTRPFVRLGDNRLALIDTGSGFGLAIPSDATAAGFNHKSGKAVQDLGGGKVESRRVEPTTVTIGSLVLRRVPTDILIGAHKDVPVLLGRGALYPFRITFDPASRLIEITPSE